jgi:hypothetical protein
MTNAADQIAAVMRLAGDPRVTFPCGKISVLNRIMLIVMTVNIVIQ